jgi:hypothetical protein
VRLVQDPSKTFESKTPEAHGAAIDLGQSSTRVEVVGTRRERIGNRQILERMREATLIPRLRGWSLLYLDGAGFEGVYAVSKGEPPVAVPASLFTWEGSMIEPRDARYTERFDGAKKTLRGTYAYSGRGLSRPASLHGVALVGGASFVERASNVITQYGQPGQTNSFRSNVTMSFSLFGVAEDEYVEGRLRIVARSPGRLSEFLPAP